MTRPTTTRPRWGFFIVLAAFAVLCRMAPQLLVKLTSAGFDMTSVNYPWGFSPMLAVALYAGAFIPNRWYAVALMLVTQLLGDLGIWALSRDATQVLDAGVLSVYFAYPLGVLLGGSLSQHRSFGRVQAGSLLSCMAFFLVTNFCVWAQGWVASPETTPMYPMTLSGLMKCYTMALPFANDFISTPLFSALLFSPLGVAQVSDQPAVTARQAEQELVVEAA